MAKFVAPSPVLSDIPDPSDVFKNPAQADFMRRMVNNLKSYLSGAVRESTAANGILMVSPSGAVFQITVADDGTLTTAHIRG